VTVLLAIFLSPLLIAVLATFLVVYARLTSLPKPSIAFLLRRSFLYAAFGAVASLAMTIAWIIWYESSAGYSAGNGPLGWIFFYGPLSVALGQATALTHWWFKKGTPLS
jgi:hypothetical protein